MEYQGTEGSIVASEDSITISYKTLSSASLSGFKKGPRRVPLTALSDVFFKPASALSPGFISFGFSGSQAPKSVMSLMGGRSPDIMPFRAKENSAFEELYRWLLQVLEYNKSNGIDPATVDYSQPELTAWGKVDKALDDVVFAKTPILKIHKDAPNPQEGALAQGSVSDYPPVTLTIYKDGTFTYTGMHGRDRLAGLDIEQDSIRRKSVTGRAAAAFATSGGSLFTSNNRGVVYLTVVGEATGSKIFTTRNPTGSVLKAHRELEAAAKSVLRGSTPGGAASPSPAPRASGADEIKKLAELRDQGILTDEEFDAKKRQILGI